MSDYNLDCMVDPQGKVYPIRSSHLDFVWINSKLIGSDHINDPTEAMERFLSAGWIRVVKCTGVEVEHLHVGNFELVKRILRSVAVSLNDANALFIDYDGGSNTYVIPMSPTGRLDFSEVDKLFSSGKHRYQG